MIRGQEADRVNECRENGVREGTRVKLTEATVWLVTLRGQDGDELEGAGRFLGLRLHGEREI